MKTLLATCGLFAQMGSVWAAEAPQAPLEELSAQVSSTESGWVPAPEYWEHYWVHIYNDVLEKRQKKHFKTAYSRMFHVANSPKIPDYISARAEIMLEEMASDPQEDILSPEEQAANALAFQKSESYLEMIKDVDALRDQGLLESAREMYEKIALSAGNEDLPLASGVAHLRLRELKDKQY